MVSLGLVNFMHAHQQINVDEFYPMEMVDIGYLQTHPLLHTIKSRSVTSVDLHTPPIGNQGALNSCVGWALCYAGVSIRLYNDYGNWSDALCSPSFLFNQYKGTIASVDTTNCDSVSAGIEHLGIRLMQEGVCSFAEMPYTTDCNLQPTVAQKIDALNKKFTVNKIPFISLNDTSLYKTALRNGWPIVVGMPMYNVFDTIWNDPSAEGIWDRVDTTDYNHNAAGHASCIVGYDDTKEAFKVMNSWGTSGGDAGYYWVKYNVVQQGVYKEALFVIQRDSAQIEGPDYLCDTTYYSVRNVPEGAACTWTVTKPSGNHAQYSISGQGTPTICVTRDTPEHPIIMDTGDAVSSFDIDIPYPPITGSVQVTVSAGGASYSANKTIRDPRGATPEVSISDTSYIWLLRTNRTFSITNCTQEPDSVFEWTVKRNSQIIPYAGSIGKTFTYRPTATGNYTITVTNRQKECGKESTSMDFYVSRAYIHPFNNASYTLELWSPVYGRMRVKNVQNADEQINTTDLPQGIYILLLKDKNGEIVEQKKIMIQ